MQNRATYFIVVQDNFLCILRQNFTKISGKSDAPYPTPFSLPYVSPKLKAQNRKSVADNAKTKKKHSTTSVKVFKWQNTGSFYSNRQNSATETRDIMQGGSKK